MSIPAPLHERAQPLLPLRVASWNLQSCRRGLPGIVSLLRHLQVDVIALQEVDRGTARSGGLDQAAFLAAEAGFPHAHFFTAARWGRGDYGLALLARAPLVEPRARPLPVPAGEEPRILASARLALPAGELNVHVTHLSHRVSQSRLRGRQAQTILELIGEERGPCLVLGDFNDFPSSAMHQTLCSRLVDVFDAVGAGASGTRPLARLLPALRIDYVFASPELQLERSQVVRTWASDHFALVAEVAVAEEKQARARVPA